MGYSTLHLHHHDELGIVHSQAHHVSLHFSFTPKPVESCSAATSTLRLGSQIGEPGVSPPIQFKIMFIIAIDQISLCPSIGYLEEIIRSVSRSVPISQAERFVEC